MELVFETDGKSTSLLFYFQDKAHSSIFQITKFLAVQLLKSVDVLKYRRIEFFIYPDNSVLGNNEHNKTAASVDMNEAVQGHNRIHIYEHQIIRGAIEEHGLNPYKFGGNNKLSQEHLISSLKQVIIHELSHIWQERNSRNFQLISANKAKINAAIERMLAHEGHLIREENHLVVYSRMRELLFDMIELVVYEGFADFNKYLSAGKITYSFSSMQKIYSDAAKCSKTVDKRINEMFKLLRQRSTNSINPEKFKEKYTFFEHDLIHHTYPIGLHIYHLILYHFLNHSIEDIGRWDYAKILNVYEETCRVLGERPVFSLSTGNGIINYQNYLKMLNDYRKNA